MQQRQFAALAAQDARPQCRGACGECVIWFGGKHQPAAEAKLVFELARPPPGVAGKNAETVKRVKQIDGFVFEIDSSDHAGERRPTGQRVCRGGPGPARAMTSDTAKAHDGVRCNWATDVDDCGLAEDVGPSGHPRKRNCVAGGNLAGPVEDDSEGALIVVVEKEDDAASEIGIVERRRRDQKRAGERSIDHWSIMPTASRWRILPTASRSWCLNHGHQLTPMPKAITWPHEVMSSPLAIGQPR